MLGSAMRALLDVLRTGGVPEQTVDGPATPDRRLGRLT
jgi:hypothetical protein